MVFSGGPHYLEQTTLFSLLLLSHHLSAPLPKLCRDVLPVVRRKDFPHILGSMSCQVCQNKRRTINLGTIHRNIRRLESVVPYIPEMG